MDQVTADALAVQNADSWKRQADNSAAFLVVMQAVNARDMQIQSQDAWLKLYEMHLKIRLGPSQIVSTTTDAVLTDMVNDAFNMTNTAWPLIQPVLAKLT